MTDLPTKCAKMLRLIAHHYYWRWKLGPDLWQFVVMPRYGRNIEEVWEEL